VRPAVGGERGGGAEADEATHMEEEDSQGSRVPLSYDPSHVLLSCDPSRHRGSH
jgi:hypothetical protein